MTTRDPDSVDDVLRLAARRWIRSLPDVAPPALPAARALRRWVAAAAAVLLLLGAGWAWTVLGPADPGGDAVLDLEVGTAPPAGFIAPTTLARVLVDTSRAVEVLVRVATEGRLEADLVGVLHGPGEGVPRRFRLVVPMAVSELGAETLRAAPGERLLLLLREEKGRLVLASGNAWSIVGARSTSFLWTADLHGTPYEARRADVLGTLRLKDALCRTAWREQGPLLVSALASGDPVQREFALDWYAMRRTGWVEEPGTMTTEQRDPEPALPGVDDALVPLLLPRDDAISTLGGSAAALLALHPAARWAAELGNPDRAEAFVLLFRALESISYKEKWDEVREALGAVAEEGGPVQRYLADGLLRRDDAVRTADLPPAERERLAGWRHVPAWPPERFLAWLHEDD